MNYPKFGVLILIISQVIHNVENIDRDIFRHQGVVLVYSILAGSSELKLITDYQIFINCVRLTE